ncbi:MAG: hypothetical protein DMG41_09510 [Acidobacteria bacterium]|nr:MAG: hypothetical protein DMG42_05830 [Acidobacteriota bacterium]PYT89172.1 MAG: hypothetical protein DMG41_09510 [Acidobacteriota bacterium]
MAAETPVISGKNGGRQGEAVYCSRCGAQMADGALLCSGCGQVFSTGAALARPMSAQVVSSAPRVHYGGFWLRFLAYLIDGAVITLGAFVVAIPLVFLTGLGTLLSQVHPEEDLNDAGFWLIMAVILLLAAVSLAVTWLYHALMESSEWQATIGKKVLDLVVTDMAGCRVSFWRATGRHFAKTVSIMIYPFGHMMAGFTQQKQALHDMIAGCLVLRRDT